MKQNHYFLNTALAVVLGIACGAAVLVRTFTPAAVLPHLDIPNMVALSLVALLLDHYVQPEHTADDTAFTLLDAIRYLPTRYYDDEMREQLIEFAAYFAAGSDPRLMTAALEYLREAQRALPKDHPHMKRIV